MTSSILRLRSRESNSPMIFMVHLSAVYLHPIVAQRIPVSQVHEPQFRAAVQRTGVAKDGRDASLPLHLVQKFGHVVDAGRHHRHPGKEGDTLLRIDWSKPFGQHLPEWSVILVGKVSCQL